MTIDDIRAAWARYMHRADLEADLALVEVLAREKIASRIMRTVDTVPEPETSPRLWLHAGMTYLHQLAQDDEGLGRELSLFDQAASDEAFRWSIDNVDPVMLTPEQQLTLEEAPDGP